MPTRSQAAKRPTSSRFARPTGTPSRRPAGRRTQAAPSRRTTLVTRRKPQKSGLARAIGGLGGMLPGARAKSARRGSTGGGGRNRTAAVAVLAGAVGLAAKNRDKLGAMMRRGGSRDDAGPPAGPQEGTPVVTGEPMAPAPGQPMNSGDRPTS
jgi:hypothetical protein